MSYNYDEICQIYDDVREADFEIVKFMVDKAGITKESHVLEVGCGTGNYLKLVHNMTKSKIWGVDQSLGMLSKAREKCCDGKFIQDDASELLNLPNSTFSLVFMVDVIHHIKDIDKTFESIKRILKDNGTLIVFSDSHEHIRNRLTSKYFPETLAPELKRYPDTSQLTNSLLSNEFRSVENGILELGQDQNYGAKLIDIATKRGCSMFGLISHDEIQKGVDRIKQDMLMHPVVYQQRACYVLGKK